jgi:hypothetical protein
MDDYRLTPASSYFAGGCPAGVKKTSQHDAGSPPRNGGPTQKF